MQSAPRENISIKFDILESITMDVLDYAEEINGMLDSVPIPCEWLTEEQECVMLVDTLQRTIDALRILINKIKEKSDEPRT